MNKSIWMAVLLVSGVVLAGSAQASSLSVYDRAATPGDVTVSAGFKVNAELGRTWIELEFGDRTDDRYNNTGDPGDSPRFRTEKIKKDRLRFEPKTGEIDLLSADLKTVEAVCAHYIPAHGLFFESIKATGNCNLNAAFTFRDVDDGFNIKKNVRFVESTLTD